MLTRTFWLLGNSLRHSGHQIFLSIYLRIYLVLDFCVFLAVPCFFLSAQWSRRIPFDRFQVGCGIMTAGVRPVTFLQPPKVVGGWQSPS